MKNPRKLRFNPLTQNLHKAVFLMDRIADQVLQEKLKLTFSQFRILLAIYRLGQITQAQTAKFHDLTPAAISRQVEILGRHKLIAVKKNASNRRQNFLSLSPAGLGKIQKALTVLDKIFQQMYAVLDRREKTVLEKALEKLVTVIQTKGKNYFCHPEVKH